MVPLIGRQIREAVGADLAQLLVLNQQLGYTLTEQQTADNLQMVQANPGAAILVAEQGGSVLGWIGLERRVGLETPPRLEITGLVVDATARRSGVGRALLAAAEDWARQHGLDMVVLRTNINRRDAHAFYQAQGFETFKTQYAMRKRLSARCE